jgi:hypothetical protein
MMKLQESVGFLCLRHLCLHHCCFTSGSCRSGEVGLINLASPEVKPFLGSSAFSARDSLRAGHLEHSRW